MTNDKISRLDHHAVDAPVQCGTARSGRISIMSKLRTGMMSLSSPKTGLREYYKNASSIPLLKNCRAAQLDRNCAMCRCSTIYRQKRQILSGHHRVFVSTEDGTGIVHIAPAFGEDDFQVGTALEACPWSVRSMTKENSPTKCLTGKGSLSSMPTSRSSRIIKERRTTCSSQYDPAPVSAFVTGAIRRSCTKRLRPGLLK